MPKIFISYHTADSHPITQTLYLLLGQYFGIENVVLDGGEIVSSDVVLVMIGQKWETLMRIRNNKETHSVRIEIENALRLKKIIIPILLKGTSILDYALLPDSIRGLQWLNALKLGNFPSMEDDLQHLLIRLDDALQTEIPSQHDSNIPHSEEDIPSFKDLISKPASKVISPERTKTLSARNLISKSLEWIKIPQGEITVKGDRFSYIPEDFQKNVFVEKFSITKYPVTNLQYAPYVSATGRTPEYWTNTKFNKPRQPVVGVSSFDVMKYCDWLSGQLGYEVTIPTEYQWQRSAQGNDGREYPWGNRWNARFANTDEKIKHTTDVHKYPKGASPYGVMDMAGNVWEWCFVEAEMDEFVNSSVVLCGGSWLNYSMFATVNARNIRLPNMDYTDVGFRLLRL